MKEGFSNYVKNFKIRYSRVPSIRKLKNFIRDDLIKQIKIELNNKNLPTNIVDEMELELEKITSNLVDKLIPPQPKRISFTDNFIADILKNFCLKFKLKLPNLIV